MCRIEDLFIHDVGSGGNQDFLKLSGLNLLMTLGGLLAGSCGDKPAPAERAARRPGSGPRPVVMASSPRPAARVARARPGPLAPGVGVTGDAETRGLLGLWGLERVEVGGMSVPLPKHFVIRLHFFPGGKLVVHGVKRTMATRSEGTWRVADGRLLSTVDGRREVRSIQRKGDRLTLTRKLLRRTVWHMKRLPRTAPQ